MLAGAITAAANIGVVTKVLGGDLVQFGDSFRARLTGIRAPQRNEPLGFEIYDFTKRQLEGQTVRLVTWTTDNTAAGIVYDEEGYARVQIFYGRLSGEKDGGVSFNEVLLKKGYAGVDPQVSPRRAQALPRPGEGRPDEGTRHLEGRVGVRHEDRNDRGRGARGPRSGMVPADGQGLGRQNHFMVKS